MKKKEVWMSVIGSPAQTHHPFLSSSAPPPLLHDGRKTRWSILPHFTQCLKCLMRRFWSRVQLSVWMLLFSLCVCVCLVCTWWGESPSNKTSHPPLQVEECALWQAFSSQRPPKTTRTPIRLVHSHVRGASGGLCWITEHLTRRHVTGANFKKFLTFMMKDPPPPPQMVLKAINSGHNTAANDDGVVKMQCCQITIVFLMLSFFSTWQAPLHNLWCASYPLKKRKA